MEPLWLRQFRRLVRRSSGSRGARRGSARAEPLSDRTPRPAVVRALSGGVLSVVGDRGQRHRRPPPRRTARSAQRRAIVTSSESGAAQVVHCSGGAEAPQDHFPQRRAAERDHAAAGNDTWSAVSGRTGCSARGQRHPPGARTPTSFAAAERHTITGGLGRTSAAAAGIDLIVWNDGDAATLSKAGPRPTPCRLTPRPATCSPWARTARASSADQRDRVHSWTGTTEMALNVLGRADTVTVNALSGTGVTAVNIDLGVA